MITLAINALIWISSNTRKEQTMSDYIFAIVLLMLFGSLFLGAVMAFFADTETFKAIDEKIANLIRGKDYE